MRYAILIVCLAGILPIVSLQAQTVGAMEYIAYPHGAEAIRLGGNYVGVGRGLAAMHFNSAALAFQPDA